MTEPREVSEPPGVRGCVYCGNLSFSQEWFQTFGVVLCNGCKAREELITKVPPAVSCDSKHAKARPIERATTLQSTAKELYLLTDKDLKKLGSIAKANPHKKDWNAMRLYMQSQAGAECTSVC